jgi:hypothetical protein
VTGEVDAGGFVIISIFALQFSLEQERCAADAAWESAPGGLNFSRDLQ